MPVPRSCCFIKNQIIDGVKFVKGLFNVTIPEYMQVVCLFDYIKRLEFGNIIIIVYV